MAEELKITKEAVLRAAGKCEQAKEVLKELFPDALKEEWQPLYSCISQWTFTPSKLIQNKEYQVTISSSGYIDVYSRPLDISYSTT